MLPLYNAVPVRLDSVLQVDKATNDNKEVLEEEEQTEHAEEETNRFKEHEMGKLEDQYEDYMELDEMKDQEMDKSDKTAETISCIYGLVNQISADRRI